MKQSNLDASAQQRMQMAALRVTAKVLSVYLGSAYTVALVMSSDMMIHSVMHVTQQTRIERRCFCGEFMLMIRFPLLASCFAAFDVSTSELMLPSLVISVSLLSRQLDSATATASGAVQAIEAWQEQASLV